MFWKKKLIFALVPLFLMLAVPAASRADTGGGVTRVTLTEAVQMARSSNVTLHQDQLAVQMDNNNAAMASGYSSTVSNSYQLQDDNLTLAAENNKVVYQTETAYFAVQDAVYGEQAAGEAVAAAQEAYRIAQVQELQGIQTPTYVAQAGSDLTQAQGNLTQAKNGVAAAYVDFDNTVGLDPSARPDLTSVATCDPDYDSGFTTAQEAVDATIKNNPDAQIAKNADNLALDMDALQTPTENQTLYLQNAGLAYQQSIQSLTSSAASAFLAVGNDQDSYNAALKAQAVAQTTYNNDLASYNAGMVAKYQVDSDEAALVSANQSLQTALHTLLEARADLALITGVGSVNVPVEGD